MVDLEKRIVENAQFHYIFLRGLQTELGTRLAWPAGRTSCYLGSAEICISVRMWAFRAVAEGIFRVAPWSALVEQTDVARHISPYPCTPTSCTGGTVGTAPKMGSN